jgi:hypothetical protein
MKVATGTVVDGRVVVEGANLAEGPCGSYSHETKNVGTVAQDPGDASRKNAAKRTPSAAREYR